MPLGLPMTCCYPLCGLQSKHSTPPIVSWLQPFFSNTWTWSLVTIHRSSVYFLPRMDSLSIVRITSLQPPLGFLAPLSSVTFVWALPRCWVFRSGLRCGLTDHLWAQYLCLWYSDSWPTVYIPWGSRTSLKMEATGKVMKETQEERERAAREEKESKEQEYRRNKGTEDQRKRRGNVKVKY